MQATDEIYVSKILGAEGDALHDVDMFEPIPGEDASLDKDGQSNDLLGAVSINLDAKIPKIAGSARSPDTGDLGDHVGLDVIVFYDFGGKKYQGPVIVDLSITPRVVTYLEDTQAQTMADAMNQAWCSWAGRSGLGHLSHAALALSCRRPAWVLLSALLGLPQSLAQPSDDEGDTEKPPRPVDRREKPP